jgi:monoamine oxidase
MKTLRAIPQALIIGGGTAGLATAEALRKQGKRAQVVEARDRRLGRVFTNTTALAQPVDEGGAWIHGVSDNPLTAPADARGLHRSETRYGLFLDSRRATEEEQEAYDATEAQFQGRLKASYERGEDVPLDRFIDPKAPFSDVLAYYYGPQDSAREASKTSSKDSAAFDNDTEDLIQEGMGTLIDRMHAHLPVQLNTPVTRIEWGGPTVRAHTASGKVIEAETAVITASTEVLRQGKIEFDPPLPARKREALEGLPLGLMNKIALQFKTDIFGPEVEESLYAVHHSSTDAADPNVLFLLKPAGNHQAVIFTGGDQAARWEKATDAEAIDFGLSRLRQVFGARVDREFSGALVTRWSSEPWILGSYSAAQPGQQHQRRILAEPLGGKLFFAGEATASAETDGTVAGALESGQRAAEEVVAALKASRAAA